MEENKSGQLELAILAEISSATNKKVMISDDPVYIGSAGNHQIASFHKIASKEDEDIYRGIVNRYYKSIA